MQKIWFCLGLFVWLSVYTVRVLAEAESTEKDGANEESARAGYLDPEQKKQLALAKTLKEHETVWLDVSYPDISETIKVLAIAQTPLIVDKQGAVLLLHDKDQHADWPAIIHPLRMNLPKAGWYTLSVNLPEETRVKPLARQLAAKAYDQVILSDSLKKNLNSGVRVKNQSEPDDAPQAETANDQTESDGAENADDQNAQNNESVDIDLAVRHKPDLNKIAYTIRALSHIQKAYEYLQTQSYQNIVLIAYRQSSKLALDYIKEHLGELKTPGFALILIEPSLPEPYLINLGEWLGEGFEAPILDVINRNDPSAKMNAEQRKQALLLAGVQSYQQLLLSFNNNKIFEENLTRRIKSWLSVNAPGMKVGN